MYVKNIIRLSADTCLILFFCAGRVELVVDIGYASGKAQFCGMHTNKDAAAAWIVKKADPSFA